MARCERYDVAIVGGGPAGVGAALASARAGARTALIERSDRLGGNAANAWVHTICGLYLPARDAAGPLHAHSALVRGLAEGLERVGAAGQPERAGRVWVLPTYPTRLGEVLAELCRGTAGLTVLTGHTLARALLPRAPGHAELVARGRTRAMRSLEAAVVIDASGDAAAAAAAGADFVETDAGDLQLPSYIYRLGGVDASELSGFAKLHVTHAVAGAVRDGSLPPECESVLVRRGRARDEVYVTLTLPRPAGGYAPLDPACQADLERQARGAALQITAFLRRTRDAFRGSRVAGWPARIGVRETRRICGEVTLTEEDVLAGQRRDDEVAVSTWPIELWHDHRRASFRYPKAPSSIPLGALTSRTHPCLAAAGRCISATHEALGAVRVIGTALATGEAAGVAAALAAGAGSALRDVAPAAVRDHIAAAAGLP